MLVVVFVSEESCKVAGTINNGSRRRRGGGESPSAAIQLNCLMSGHQETFQLITSAVAVSSLARVRPALINTATASVHQAPGDLRLVSLP